MNPENISSDRPEAGPASSPQPPFGQAADEFKTNTHEAGLGGNDAASALRYLLATGSQNIFQIKLTGLS